MLVVRFITFSFLLVMLTSVRLFGQDCSETLIKAQETYKEGRIDEISDMLKPCLEGGFNKQEQIEAHRLLTLTFLYFNELEKAQGSMKNLLKVDPEYKLRQIDPTEFVNLYNSFRTSPILLVGAKFGPNFLDMDVIKNYSLDNSAVSRGEYKSKLGFHVSFFTHFPLSKKLSLLTEVQYSVKSFTYSDELFNYAQLDFPEKQTYLEIPVLFNYSILDGKWVPYFSLGGSLGYLIKAKAEPIRKDVTGDNTQREIEGQIDVTSLRKSINYNLVGSIGIKVKDVLGRGYLFVDLRYTRGLNNVIKAENRYSNDDLIYKFLYIDNDVRMNTFQYSFGYSYPLYKPKLKKVKPQDNL